MANPRRKPSIPIVKPPSVLPERGIELLTKQRDKALELLNSRPLTSDQYAAWENTTREFLVMAFGPDSPNVRSVMDIGHYGSFPMNASEQWWENHRALSLQRKTSVLESCIEVLETQVEGTKTEEQEEELPIGDRVFLVHGRDQAMREETARFLEHLSVEVVILREQPNSGRTIIEKFIDYSDVGFAVVLLTGDDRGGLRDEPYESQKPRARQNVLLELGFFLGKLGRQRVCALYQDGVDIPTDYQGVAFVRIDDGGGWRLEVARELKAAGFPIDMNRAL